MNVVMFLVQVMGIVKLSIFVRERIFLFIFAGEDGVLSHAEQAALDVFNSLLVKKIMQTYAKPQAIALMLNEKACGRVSHGFKPQDKHPGKRDIGTDKTA